MTISYPSNAHDVIEAEWDYKGLLKGTIKYYKDNGNRAVNAEIGITHMSSDFMNDLPKNCRITIKPVLVSPFVGRAGRPFMLELPTMGELRKWRLKASLGITYNIEQRISFL